MVDDNLHIITREKKSAHCTAGHKFEWYEDDSNKAPVTLLVDERKFCMKCVAEKMMELGIGEMVDD